MVITLKFSLFLQKIYKAINNKITKQEDFVQQLFKTCCPTFSYTDDYCKKMLNGSKPLSDDLRTYVFENSDYDKLPRFFEEHINKKHFVDLLDEFEVYEDEKKDLSILAEALTYQFSIYIEYGENNLPTSVKSIYETLIDQYGNGAIENANEKALFAAYQFLYQAITALSSISISDDILTLQGPFENFFSFIFKAYRAYESHCNREGKEIYNYVKDKILDGKLAIDDYLQKITEPGALPFELIKELHFTIYDNYKFQDKDLHLTIRLFEEQERKKVYEIFRNFEFYPVNEIFFTQRISFRLEGNNNNLINDAQNICFRTDTIFSSIGLNLKQNDYHLLKITKKIEKAFRDLKRSTVQYILDGTYFPEKHVLRYAPSTVPMYGLEGGPLIETGMKKFDFVHHPILGKDIPFESKFKLLVEFQNEIWKKQKYQSLMAEMYTLNKDNTYRLYLVPVTSKARIYRLIRAVSETVYADQMIGFIFTSIVVYNAVEAKESLDPLMKMTSEERIKIGKDELLSNAYYNDKIYSLSITKENSILGKKPEENYQPSKIYVPLIRHIHFCDFVLKHEEKTNQKIISK